MNPRNLPLGQVELGGHVSDLIVKVPKPRPRCCVVVREKVVAVEFQHVVGGVNGKSHLEG